MNRLQRISQSRVPSISNNIHHLTQSTSSLYSSYSTRPNHRNLLLLIDKLTGSSFQILLCFIFAWAYGASTLINSARASSHMEPNDMPKTRAEPRCIRAEVTSPYLSLILLLLFGVCCYHYYFYSHYYAVNRATCAKHNK